jgi:hypothetical protein
MALTEQVIKLAKLDAGAEPAKSPPLLGEKRGWFYVYFPKP